MRSSKKTGIAALVALILGVAMLAGCTPASSNLDCTPAALESAKAELQTAQAAADKDGVKGTGSPDEVNAQAIVKMAQDKVDQLTTCAANPTRTPTPTASPTDSCLAEFVQDPPERGEHGEYAKGGIVAIVQKYLDKNITNPTPEQKRDAQLIWTGHDALELASVVDGLGWRLGGSSDGLTTADGHCLSEEGKNLFIQYKGWVAANATTANTVITAEATNTAAQGSQVVAEAGVSGTEQQRSGWRLTAPNGAYLEWLDRCANSIRPGGTPSIPEGPTDNGLYPKNINDAPQRQGNLPTQQMPNVLPASPEYAQPAEPTSPPATYVPPVAPAPAPPVSQPAPVPTKDPAPAPAPQPSAPTPDKPETGYDPSAP